MWIGMMDSGVGGLTVAKEVFLHSPQYPIVYFGDSRRCPYGSRDAEEVVRYSKELVCHLSLYPLRMLVVACNTATAVALPQIREMLPVPVVGVIEPGSRAALAATKTGNIGVIGTEGTIKSGAYERELLRIDPEVRVVSLSCPAFVPLVEQGLYASEKAREVVQNALSSLQQANVDTLILGCTHYPLLQPLIQEVMGEDVTLINSAEETAREVARQLGGRESGEVGEAVVNGAGDSLFFTSGNPETFSRVLREWVGVSAPVLVKDPTRDERKEIELSSFV